MCNFKKSRRKDKPIFLNKQIKTKENVLVWKKSQTLFLKYKLYFLPLQPKIKNNEHGI